MGEPSAIKLPNGKILTRMSSRADIWAARRDAVMGKLVPGEKINALTYRWMNEMNGGEDGDGSVLETQAAAYGRYPVNDEFSLFAIYDPACYASFVSNFWDWDKLQEHFIDQMGRYRFLGCSTGKRGEWRIEIKHEPVLLSGAREMSGSIMAAGSRLILCDYGHLTMGAQFDDIKLPDDEPFGAYEIKVRPGTYNIRVIQINLEPKFGNDPDIILEILKASSNPLDPWKELAWQDETARMN